MKALVLCFILLWLAGAKHTTLANKTKPTLHIVERICSNCKRKEKEHRVEVKEISKHSSFVHFIETCFTLFFILLLMNFFFSTTITTSELLLFHSQTLNSPTTNLKLCVWYCGIRCVSLVIQIITFSLTFFFYYFSLTKTKSFLYFIFIFPSE
jgi:hypothetical protein